MLDQYQFHNMILTWLEGVDLYVDGGRVFGPVPKEVWKRYVPYNDKNQVPNSSDPILIQYHNKNYLIDASSEPSKMSAKEKRNAGVHSENKVLESLNFLGLTAEDIDTVLLTHVHDDHIAGLSYLKDGELISTFPNAEIYVHEYDWHDVQNPDGRTKNTYLKRNWQPIVSQVRTFSDKIELAPGIRFIHTGGHTRGMSIVELIQNNERILHMGDNFANIYHLNVNWVMSIDDYPLEVTKIRKKWFSDAFKGKTKFSFYHDPYVRLAKFNLKGEKMICVLARSKSIGMEVTEKQDKLSGILIESDNINK